MDEIITKEEVEEIIRNVEHPEIACTLGELGMIGNLEFDATAREGKFTLVLPMLNIPVQIRNMILNSIGTALGSKVTKMRVSLAEMNDVQREKFFALSKANWKL